MSKKRWVSRKRSNALRDLFQDTFPSCFSAWGAPKQPLKAGIHRDLKAHFPDLPMREIREALANYCGGPTYLRSMVEGAVRLDLDGNQVGFVAAAHAAYAAHRLKKLQASWAANNKPEQLRKEAA